jgi:hypothetical protein
MNNTFERTWEAAVMTYFDALFLQLPGEKEESHKKPRLVKPIFRPRFEPGFSPNTKWATN